MNHTISKLPNTRERGAALVVALMMLLVMTILGVTAMQMSRMEERMAGNVRDVNIAFQGAEAGLRDGEDGLRALNVRPVPCVTAPCNVWRRDVIAVSMRDQPLSWWVANGRQYGPSATKEVSDATRDPMYVVEEVGFVPDSLAIGHGPPEGRNFYRVTSSGAGASDTSEAVLESTYAKRF
jgi:type IV pilus assembly protein PilX